VDDIKPILFQWFPRLEEHLGWVSLGRFPTAVSPLNTLAKRIGARSLWIKRDDRTARIFGGSKVRKLEWTLGHAVRRGRQHVLTVGSVGSLHVLATAVHAQRQQLNVHAIQYPRPITDYVRRSMQAIENQDIHLIWSPRRFMAPFIAAWTVVRSWFQRSTQRPMYIPGGGSDIRGTLGYVEAALELKTQIDRAESPEPAAIIVPVATGGTLAGLILGCRIAGLSTRVIGVRVVPADHCRTVRIRRLANGALRLLRRAGMDRKISRIRDADIEMVESPTSTAYGVPTAPSEEAVSLLADTERITLDTTFTGKSMSTMLRRLVLDPELREEPVLFWHTYTPPRFHRVQPNAPDASRAVPNGYQQFRDRHWTPTQPANRDGKRTLAL